MKISLIISLIAIVLFVHVAFCQTGEEKTVVNHQERRLFYLLNAMRKDRKIKPLKFSPSLYQEAKKLSEGMAVSGVLKTASLSNKEKDAKLSGGNARFRAVLSSGANYIEETVSVIKNHFSHYRTVINAEYTEAAIAIVRGKKTGLYYMTQILRKGDKESNAYYLEAKEFEEILQLLSIRDISEAKSDSETNSAESLDKIKKIVFGINQQSAIDRLDAFIHHAKNRYSTTISASSIMIYLKDAHPPLNYIQITSSSVVIDIYPGVNTITYFFKERNYIKEKELLEEIYGTAKNPPDKWKNSPYYFHRYDERLKLAYWVTENEIVEFRWLGEEGVYVTVTKADYGWTYINYLKDNFNLKHPIPKRLYLRFLIEFLKRSSHLEVTDFIKLLKVSHYTPERVKQTKMVWNERETLKIKSNYNDKGDIIREDFYKNQTMINSWFFRYNIKGDLIKIETVPHTKEGTKKSYDVPVPVPSTEGATVE